MISEKVHDWLQIVGMVAIVASLVFVGWQIKQSDEIAMVELLDNAAVRNFELSTLRANHADVWQKACLGAELSSAERIIASSIYFSFLQHNWNTWFRQRSTGFGAAQSDYLTDIVAVNLHRYPGLMKIGLSYRDFHTNVGDVNAEYTPIYREAIRSRLAELEQLEAKPPHDVMWCGLQ